MEVFDLASQKKHGVHIGGCSEFAQINKLAIGDVCVFELIDRINFQSVQRYKHHQFQLIFQRKFPPTTDVYHVFSVKISQKPPLFTFGYELLYH